MGPLHFADNGARDEIARREVARRFIPGHEALASFVDQPRAFPAERFGQEESWRAGHAHHRRMELHEFEIRNARAGIRRHRDAVAGGDRWIRRLAKHLAGAAGCQQRPSDSNHAAVTIARDVARATACAIGHEELGRTGVLQDPDARVRAHPRPEQPADLAPRRIARVQDAPDAVRRFARQRGRAVTLAIERSAPREQLDDVLRTFANEHVDGSGVAEAVAGGQRVLRMQFRRVVRTKRRGDAALRITGVAFAGIGLRENNDVARRRERQRGAQTGDSAADDEKISAHIHFAILLEP